MGLFFLCSCNVAVAATDREPPSKPAFYATSAACVAGRLFNKYECDNAFADAPEELRAQQLASLSKIDCILRFHLCERSGPEGLYAPVALGVEMVRTSGVAYTTPVLAVPTPEQLLPPRPVMPPSESAYDPGTGVRRLIVLPTDHFEPVDPRLVREASSHFLPRQNEIEPEAFAFDAEREAPSESAEARRARLLAAPFVE